MGRRSSAAGCRQCVSCLCSCRAGATECHCGLFADGQHVSRHRWPLVRPACTVVFVLPDFEARFEARRRRDYRDLPEPVPAPGGGVVQFRRRRAWPRETFAAMLPPIDTKDLPTTGLAPEDLVIEFVRTVDAPSFYVKKLL